MRKIVKPKTLLLSACFLLLFSACGKRPDFSTTEADMGTMENTEDNPYYSVEKPYTYPAYPGTDEWLALETTNARREACQIPADVLSELTTEELFRVVLDCPLIGDMAMFSTMRVGYEKVVDRFNGLQELEQRPDLQEVLQTFDGESFADSLEEGKAHIARTAYHLIYRFNKDRLLGTDYSVDEMYSYSVIPGTDEWSKLTSHNLRVAVCQIPEEEIAQMTTYALLHSVLLYPLWGDIFAAESIQTGYEQVLEEFSGLQELLKRQDLSEELRWISRLELEAAFPEEYQGSIAARVWHLLTDLYGEGAEPGRVVFDEYMVESNYLDEYMENTYPELIN